MSINKKLIHTLNKRSVCMALALFILFSQTHAETKSTNRLLLQDTTVNPPSLPFPLTDRRGDNLSIASYNQFDYFKPTNQRDSIVFDYETKRYIVYEKIGNRYLRTPVSYSFNEYWSIKNRQAELDYFQKRSNTTNILNRGKFVKPRLSLTDNLFNRLFGNGKIEICYRKF